METKRGGESMLSAPYLGFHYCTVPPLMSFAYLPGLDINTLSHSSKNPFAIPLPTTHLLNYSPTQQEVCRGLEMASQYPKRRAQKDTGDT